MLNVSSILSIQLITMKNWGSCTQRLYWRIGAYASSYNSKRQGDQRSINKELGVKEKEVSNCQGLWRATERVK